ncbi:exonuclease IX [Salmonella enterica subsp. enterica]|uniref:Exonuclease IX n=1 Tax=Salmonella enterica I TaxID=59201 RepID=A0A3S5DMI2_SALET|nr:exonuclease IX [Salmonella enterica subsp. enterica]
MAAHLLIVDALNLIRRIHAVQGSPCVETCQHALDQLIIHSQPTHAVAVFDDDARSRRLASSAFAGLQSRTSADA